MTDNDIHDAIIVGGGSTGLSAALQLARLRFRVLVLDSDAPRNRFAAHMHGVLGRDHTSPLALLADGRRELSRYDVEVRQDAASTASRDDELFTVTTDSGAALRARAVLVATGASDTLPDVPGVTERWGRGVHHCPFCDGWENRGKRIGVLAESAESFHQIRMLRRLSDRVTVLSHGPTPFDESQLAHFAAAGIALDDRVLDRVLTTDEGIRGAAFDDDGEIALDALFVSPRATPRDDILVALSAERVEAFGRTWAGVDAMGRTSVPGLWAAGNVVNPMLGVAASIAAGATAGYGMVAELLMA
ncbi:NAD(P)/FAD-dependent oxidoreductase [Microbacterium protaetiae]|nr:NAD(P)/FAD-dependent oxidoreductase [Microbacterium protaetiae]